PMPGKPAPYVDLIAPPDADDLIAFGKLLAAQDANRLETTRQRQISNWWMDLILKENLSIREHMTLLWSNHFVTGTDVVPLTGYTYTYNQMLRANALGNLKSFVRAVSIDPSMLVYLNGNQNYVGKPPGSTRGSTGSNINENYARELQELFTLGLNDPITGDPNYTEDDVQQAAKALTGWAPTTVAPFQGIFYPASHSNDTKTFLGKSGNWALDDIIDIIFSYTGPKGSNAPGFNTAYWFCQKIYMEFVYYVPNPDVVTAMANLLVQSNFELKPVLKALLESDHFYDPNVLNAQLKSPVNFIASLVREFGLTYTPFDPTDPSWSGNRDSNNIKIYTDPNPTLTYLTTGVAGTSLGQQLLQPPNVKGWPGGHNWISTGTFQQREIYSYTYLLNPPVLDGGTKVKGVKVEFLSPTAWAQALTNFLALKSHDISTALTSIVLNKTLGPNESGTLYSSLNAQNLPDSDFYLTDKNVSDFAIALANLPEFQLV
ncbi:MAG: DUF1800 family protein, partial [Bacteroidota bacterium]|nr:DUF1800 family protein [Bacteroidota bacterium]